MLGLGAGSKLRKVSQIAMLIETWRVASMDDSGTTLLNASFDDIERYCAEVRAWDLDFKPLSSALAGGSVAEVIQMRFGEVDLSYTRLTAPVDQKGEPPPGRHTFTILSPRTKYLWWRGHDVGPDDVMVFRAGADFASVSGNDFECHLLSMTEDRIQAVAEREALILPPLHRRPEVFRPAPALLASARSFLVAARHAQPGIAGAVVRDVADRLVVAWLAQSGIKRAHRKSGRKERALTESLELIHAHPHQQLAVAKLCIAAGVARRTLESAFHDQFGLGPAAFMKQRRLADVRRALLAADPAADRVADVMEHFGFAHVGQFAADYRVMFGERPSETIAVRSRP
jgi:AraC-like DNA-binding protein